MARANRVARLHFVAAARDLVLSKLGILAKYAELPDGDRGRRFERDCWYAFREVYIDTQPELNSDALLTEGERETLSGHDLPTEGGLEGLLEDAAAGWDGTFGELALAFEDFPEGKVITDATRQRRETEFRESARATFLTGIALARLLKAASGRAETISLEGVAILGADLRDAKLGGIGIFDSYVAGNLSGADLQHARLGDSNLTHAKLAHANLSWTFLLGAVLPGVDNPKGGTPHSVNGGWLPLGPNAARKALFEGADWWDTVNAWATERGPITVGFSETLPTVQNGKVRERGKARVINPAQTCGEETQDDKGDEYSFSMYFCWRLGESPILFANIFDKEYPKETNLKKYMEAEKSRQESARRSAPQAQ